MKKVINYLGLDSRDITVTIVLPILVMALPYCLMWVWSSIFDTETHNFLFTFRFFSVAGIVVVGALSKLKIEFVEKGWLKNKNLEKWIDIFLTLLIWPAFALMMFFCIPAIILVMILSAIKGDSLTVERFIIGVVYFLAITSLFVLGVDVQVKGSFPEDNKYVGCLNHESSIDYFIWPFLAGLGLSKIIAGTNLVKFPGVGQFIEARSIMIDRNAVTSIVATLKKVKCFLAKGYRLFWNPGAGRDRLSGKGIMKKFKSGVFGILDETIAVVPILVLETMKYKPPMKGEINFKKLSLVQKIITFLEFQWWSSPRRIHVVIMGGINRAIVDDMLEDREVFTKRVYDLMTNQKEYELTLLESIRKTK